MNTQDRQFMDRAIQLARYGMELNAGGPFGAVVVRDQEIIGEGYNEVTSANDPTAHAEIVAIRLACETLNSFQLEGCTIYSTCEPCPMCLGAIYWARPDRIVYACTRSDVAAIGFDDMHIFHELIKPDDQREITMQYVMRKEALALLQEWENKKDKLEY